MKVRIGGPFQFTPEMITNVHKVMEAGRVSPGPFVKEFERRFAQYHGVNHAVMTNSGTSALVIALQALKEIERWPDGSEVIVPAITFVATVNAVFQCRLKPVLVDVDPRDYTINTRRIERAITPHTKAIMPVHVFGSPCDMEAVWRLAADHNLEIIEDACEALGATCNDRCNDRRVGTLGHIGCFSFYMSHHITAGVGGMAITNNGQYARKMFSLINHGWERETVPMDAAEFDFEEMRKRYYFTSLGHSFRPTELEAAIAIPQLATLEKNIHTRKINVGILIERLAPYTNQIQRTWPSPHGKHAFMMCPLILHEGNKWGLMQHLEENGIQTREMLPLTNQPCYKGLFDEDDYPVAKWINEQGFYVGCSQYLTGEHMNYVVEKIGEWLNG